MLCSYNCLKYTISLTELKEFQPFCLSRLQLFSKFLLIVSLSSSFVRKRRKFNVHCLKTVQTFVRCKYFILLLVSMMTFQGIEHHCGFSAASCSVVKSPQHVTFSGLEKDYATWRRAFWKTVENGLKRDQTFTKNHKTCESSVDGKCCCQTDRSQHSLIKVQLIICLRYLFKSFYIK